MATSMQFGPEWMRKAPAKNSNSSSSGSKDPSSPASATATSIRGDSIGPPASGGSAPGSGRRNGAGGGVPAALNGPTPVTSPTVTSPGAFSFAAAAGGAASAAAAGSNHQHPSLGGSSQDGDSAASAALANGAAKDRQSREKLLSLYSTDRPAKTPSSEAGPPLENGTGSDKPGAFGRKKNGTDRDQRRLSNFGDLGASGGPLSPNLVGDARGIGGGRSISGGSSGGFGSAGTSNWDRADKERPGLFQRASSSALTGSASAARPLSPSMPRERFSGIQGGVLSGVGPQSRKRMDSENGTTVGSRASSKQPSSDDVIGGANAPGPAGSGQSGAARGGSAGFSDAFVTNKARGKASGSEGATNPGQEGDPAESAGAFGRFNRTRDRQPGEGPIGPPADGSAGFNKFAGYDRKRERQASYVKPGAAGEGDAGHAPGDGSEGQRSVNQPGGASGEKPSGAQTGSIHQSGAGAAQDSSIDSDLAHHATSVLGSLKLDDDDNSASMLASEPLKPTSPTWSADTAMWLYRDPSGQVQGPFTAVIMQDWYRQSYFSDELMVRRQEDADFRPLAQVIASIGNALQPFLVPPHNWFHNPDAVNGVPEQVASRRTSNAGDAHDGDGHEARSGHVQDASGPDGARFAGQMDAMGGAGWGGGAPHGQQWSSQLNLGFGPAGPQPMSPFGRQDIFGGQGGLDNRFRTQEELVAMIREREMQEQRQAAAAAAARGQNLGYGQVDPFMGVLGRGGWDAPGAANWTPHGGLPTFDPAFNGHQSPLIGERPAFEAFNKRPDQSGTWGQGPATPRSHFEQPNPFNRAQNWDAQGGWNSQGNMTPETPNRQVPELQDGGFRHDKPFSDPIGTPRRARSPAAASPALDQHVETFETRQEEPKSDEQTHVDAPVRDVAAEAAPAKEPEAAPAVEAKAEPVQTKPPATQAEPRPAAPTPAVEEEPGPEQLWPQSPKAVEFASEPDFSSMPGLSLSGKPSAGAAQDTRRAAARATEAKAEQAKRTPSRQTASSGNVRVVSQEQFRRSKEEESANLNQVPLSAWLPDATGGSAPAAPKPAPWAAREDVSSATTPGPSLREIQEAEAKRAEARKAAERAAATQRAKAASALGSSNDDLPTSMSWGLASVPATRSMATSSFDTPLTPSSTSGPSTPAWSAGKASTPKKTLTEIQEEERKRAEKQKQQQAAQAIALRKGYADSASRTAVPSAAAAASAGGAWSVVGASGKSNAPSPAASPAAAAASRPATTTAQRTSSVGVVPGAGSGWSTAGAKPSPSVAAASPATPSRVASQPAVGSSALKPKPAPSPSSLLANDPNQPSPEFVRYLKDNLKGLTIRVDDFIEMLMSFPLDPSPDVIEIIAESVYANSSTLDGRRFAADFVSKRKMDAQGRQPVGGSSSASSAPFQSKWSAAGSSGGMGSFGSGAGVGGATSSSAFGRSGGATSPQMSRSAADVMKGGSASVGGKAGSGGVGVDSFGGFKVVKAKGSKKRGN